MKCLAYIAMERDFQSQFFSSPLPSESTDSSNWVPASGESIAARAGVQLHHFEICRSPNCHFLWSIRQNRTRRASLKQWPLLERSVQRSEPRCIRMESATFNDFAEFDAQLTPLPNSAFHSTLVNRRSRVAGAAMWHAIVTAFKIIPS